MGRLDAMLAFAPVVEAGSFTRAAETLQMSKSSVTQLVQQLEDRLRVKLLSGTTRQVKVTPDGSACQERVVRLLANMEDAGTSLSDASASPRCRLRVDVPSPPARMILVPALPSFLTKFPDIQLHIRVSDRVVDLIGDNVDCVVRGGEIAAPSLMARRVGELRAGLCAAPSCLECAGTPLHPRELEDTHHRIVGFPRARTGKILPYAMRRDGESIEVRGRHVLAVDDGNAYLAAGLAGLGILWLPRHLSEPHVANGGLVRVLEGWRFDPMPLYVAYPPNRHISAKLRVFIDWVVELMARHAPVSKPGRPVTSPGRSVRPAVRLFVCSSVRRESIRAA